MRNIVKKLISAAMAALTVMSVAVSAAAADYASAPSYAPASGIVTAVSSSSVKQAVSAAAIAANGAASVEVKGNRNVVVNAAAIKKLVNSKAVLEVVSPKATFVIDGSTVTSVKKINLSCKILSSSKSIKVKFDNKKNFGCEVQIIVTDCKMSAKKLASANVYCDGELVGPVELDENNKPIIKATKGGVYEIK